MKLILFCLGLLCLMMLLYSGSYEWISDVRIVFLLWIFLWGAATALFFKEKSAERKEERKQWLENMKHRRAFGINLVKDYEANYAEPRRFPIFPIVLAVVIFLALLAIIPSIKGCDKSARVSTPVSLASAVGSDPAKGFTVIAPDLVRHDTLLIDSDWQEIRGSIQHSFRFDFDQSNTLQVRLANGRIFEKTGDQWFFNGDSVSGLPMNISPFKLFVRSKGRAFEAEFSTWPK